MTSRPGALSLLSACLLPVLGGVAINSPRVGVVCVLAEAVALGWLAVDVRGSAVRLAVALLAAGSIAGSTWLYGGHQADSSVGAALRILYIVLPAVLVTPQIRPSPLGDALAQRLKLPARPVVAAVAALQRLDSLSGQWQQVRRARRARGLGADGGLDRRVRHLGGAAFGLLVVAMRQTGTAAAAMDARGFAGATRRTWAEAAPWRGGDTLVLALALGLAALPWVLRAGPLG